VPGRALSATAGLPTSGCES